MINLCIIYLYLLKQVLRYRKDTISLDIYYNKVIIFGKYIYELYNDII